MRKISKVLFSLVVLAAITTACGTKGGGELTGVLDRPGWKGNINPYGMVYIPSGTLHIGPGDQDMRNTYVQRPKSISIQGFYMDDTEITNNEYRQFVNWVRDEKALQYLEYWELDDDGNETGKVDWEYRDEIDWEDGETLGDLFYEEESFIQTGDEADMGGKTVNVEKLVYEYTTYDWKAAAAARQYGDLDQFSSEHSVNIYPDIFVWIRDFSYSYNEPMTRNYFWHPAFDDYPVVGVNWKMADAFVNWRTELWNDIKATQKGEVNTEDFRLPTEHEWEYAARGGHDLAPYPWGGYYTRNGKGCLLANFKPGRGNYPEDGGLYTVKVDYYFPNDFGLYNMAGNVAEWTSSAYYENAYSFLHDLNPDIRYDATDEDYDADMRKVIRGGSWKDVAYFLRCGTRHWEYQDTTKSYVGFRSALTFLGRSIDDFTK